MGIGEVPISFSGKVVALGVILKSGIFSYELLNSDLIAMIHTNKAEVVVGELAGHYFAEICLIS
jgi:hypothetical protein